MKNIGIALAAIMVALLMVSVPAQAAGIHNVSLTGVGSSGVAGSASTIVGNIGGSNPYQNVEVNARMNQAAPSGSVYQGWLIDSKDNYKLSLGAFTGTDLSFREKMVSFDCIPYDSMAVSIEPAGSRNVNPTTIVAQGSLPGSSIAASDYPAQAVLPSSEAFQRQAVTSRFNITADQYNSLRAMAWSPSEISLMGSVAQRCNKSTMDVASMLSQGQSWDQIASSCNMTTAQLFSPFPAQAVAGSQQQLGMAYTPGGVPVVTEPVFYRRYANGRPVITRQDWNYYRKAGYSWEDVALAANIAAETGVDPGKILRMVSVQGYTWPMVAMYYGLDYRSVRDISAWPFSEPGGGASYSPPPATQPTGTPPAPEAPSTTTPSY